ncbi:MAG: hypothetical protein QUS11_09880 [Candidatus Fermentibacter sp.]|nr:hypothetical protein [Candidatus Fermentibacter sp.]
MKSTLLAATAFIASGCIAIGCVDSSGPVSFPVPPSDIDHRGDNASIPMITSDSCFHNVAILCALQSMYYGTYNCYAGSILDLYELYGDTLRCPWTLGVYEVAFCSPDSYFVQCQEYPVHPGGGPGTCWNPDQRAVVHCRSHMMSIATMEAMFYGQFDRYGTMDEMIEAGIGPYMACPGCHLDYIIDLGQETYTLICPLPSYPNHGSVVTGDLSWD